MSSAVIGALRVNLGADTAAFQTGLGKASRSMAGFSQSVSTAMRPVSAMRGQLQNIGYQVQDVAVQISSGTSAFRALGQQLPQLLSGFGGIGIAAGTVARVGFALAGSLFQSGKEASTATGAVDGLAEALTAAKAAGELFTLSNADLTARFGSVAEGARLAAAQIRDAISATAEGVRAKGVEGLATLSAELAKIDAALAELPPNANKAGADIAELALAFDLPQEMARELVEQMRAFQQATTAPAMSAALQNIY